LVVLGCYRFIKFDACDSPPMADRAVLLTIGLFLCTYIGTVSVGCGHIFINTEAELFSDQQRITAAIITAIYFNIWKK
jgi:hypothetical protein